MTKDVQWAEQYWYQIKYTESLKALKGQRGLLCSDIREQSNQHSNF